MKVLWDLTDAAPSDASTGLTAGEVVQRVAGQNRWRPRTVKTLLNRLVQKRAAEMRAVDGPGGRRFLYRARIPRDACVRHETRWFLSRVFGGAVGPAMVHFLEQAGSDLSAEEVEQLRRILDQHGAPEAEPQPRQEAPKDKARKGPPQDNKHREGRP